MMKPETEMFSRQGNHAEVESVQITPSPFIRVCIINFHFISFSSNSNLEEELKMRQIQIVIIATIIAPSHLLPSFVDKYN